MDLAELGSVADRYHKVRQDRLAADKVATKLKTEEDSLAQLLISEMRESEISSIGGKIAIIKRTTKEIPFATDWESLYSYIKEHDAFDLLHKRIGVGAAQLRKDDGVEVPGLGWMERDSLTISEAPK